MKIGNNDSKRLSNRFPAQKGSRSLIRMAAHTDKLSFLVGQTVDKYVNHKRVGEHRISSNDLQKILDDLGLQNPNQINGFVSDPNIRPNPNNKFWYYNGKFEYRNSPLDFIHA